MASWLGRWICDAEVLGSNPPPCHWMDLCLVVPDSAPPCFVNSQLVSLPSVGIFNKFLLNLQYIIACFSVPQLCQCRPSQSLKIVCTVG